MHELGGGGGEKGRESAQGVDERMINVHYYYYY